MRSAACVSLSHAYSLQADASLSLRCATRGTWRATLRELAQRDRRRDTRPRSRRVSRVWSFHLSLNISLALHARSSRITSNGDARLGGSAFTPCRVGCPIVPDRGLATSRLSQLLRSSVKLMTARTTEPRPRTSKTITRDSPPPARGWAGRFPTRSNTQLIDETH